MIYGTDVSNWQSEKFPLTLSDGAPVDFVIIQVTRGMDGVNEKWRGQVAWAREHGLAVGFYHFGKAADSPDAQARRFWAELHGKNGDQVLSGETLWYDWENSGTPSTAPTNAQKDQFITELKRLAPKRRVGLYCNVDFWKNRDTTDFYGDALWIASWSARDESPPIQTSWEIHQYADGPGIDHDRALFSSRDEMKVWGGKPEDPTVSALRALQADFSALARVVSLQGEVLSRLERNTEDLDTDVVDEFVKRLTGL
jgi:GH25 family lysozyme M1 (1,4-beta-N-acetylmuramidase)